MDAMTSKRAARPEEPTKVPAAEPRIHSLAVVEPGARIGPRTRVWAFAHVLPGAVVGADCNLCDHTFVEGAVRIGDRVTVKCGVYLWDGVTLEDDVFVGPCAVFTNDKFPRSRRRPARYLQTVVGQGASIGANATLLPGVRIGKQAMVGAGAVVTRDVPAYAVVRGNPARIAGYVDAAAPVDRAVATVRWKGAASATGARLLDVPNFSDMRGDLGVLECGPALPFAVKRLFYVYNVPGSEVRGAHAHKRCHQFLVAVAGSLHLVADNGAAREEFVLDSPKQGLYLPAGVWGTQYRYAPGTVCLVLASQPYDAADYVRDYDDYLRWRRRRK